MNCPKCNLQTLPDQKFCRSCGASLQIITQPLAEYAAVTPLERTPAITFRAEEQQTNRLTVWGFMIMFIGVAIGVTGKMLLHQELVTVVGVLLSLLGMFLTVYPYLSPAPRQKREATTSTPTPEVLTQAQPEKYLPPESRAEFVPSIAERTTDLLIPAPARTRKKDDRESPA